MQNRAKFIILLRCDEVLCVILKCRVVFEPPLLESPLPLVLVSVIWKKKDPERKGSFSFGSESL